MILYNFFAENKINVCLIHIRDIFYCLIKENEGIYEQILIGFLSDIQKEDIINDISQRQDISEFFKNYIKDKINDI